MIILTRVDHRLLHGQVAFSWTQSLGADSILIANDDAMNNELRKTSIKLAKPQGVKLVIKSIDDAIDAINSGVTDKYRLFVIVETIADAVKMAEACDQIQHINIGGTKPNDQTRSISKTVYVTDNDIKNLKELKKLGKEIEIRQVPSDKKIDPLK